jgi:hypothetical protein
MSGDLQAPEMCRDVAPGHISGGPLGPGGLRERIDAAYRALQAAGEVVPRGPAGDTMAEKITALVAILRAALAERDELRALVAADTAKMLEMMGRRS